MLVISDEFKNKLSVKRKYNNTEESCSNNNKATVSESPKKRFRMPSVR